MKLRVFSLSIFVAFSCIAQLNATTIPSDNKIFIDKGWQFLRQDVGSPWEVFRKVIPGQPESVPVWQSVTLPHCFNSEDAVDPQINYYQGVGWYRSTLSLRALKNGEKVIVEIEGAGQKTDLYIANKHVAHHVGGYDGWYADVTDYVKSNNSHEGIPIAFKCDNSRDVDMIPSDMSDFTLYGGLYRKVNIVYLPSRYISDIRITPFLTGKHNNATIDIKTYFQGERDDLNSSLNISIRDAKGKIVASTTKADCALQMKNIKVWYPENPYLYHCDVEWIHNGIKQTFTETFGFKDYEFKEKGAFFLNGKRLLLRGTHIHEDFAGVGAAMTDNMIIDQVKQMKNMGVNFIRLGHYQQSELMLNLCDSLGIIVWEEIPWCRGGIGNANYRKQAKDMLKNMIEQHYNHTSIILWGLGNETDWKGDFEHTEVDSVRNFMSELNNLSHKLDSTRLTTIRRNDYCKDIVDVYSPSIWMGWYSSTFDKYLEAVKKQVNSTKRFIHAEWGGDSHARRHTEVNRDTIPVANKNGDWSETYIIRLFDWCLKEQEKMPWLSGSAFWTFRDFATPLRPENPIPYVNQKGVVERDGTLKESYFVFQSYWSENPMVHIYGHSWPVRWGEADEEKEVLAYSNCDKAELFVNGVSQGVKKRNSQDFPAAGLRWYVRYKEGENHLNVVAYKASKIVTDSIHQEYQTQKWGEPAKISISSKRDDNGYTVVCAQLLDANNIRCLDAKDFILFGYTGDGTMVENQGTSTGSSYIQLYNGRAYIKIKGDGKGVISAKIENIPIAFLEL